METVSGCVTGASCCVTGCHSLANNTKRILFYNFPNRPHETERRMLWIEALKSGVEDFDEFWQPGKHSVICSAHFVGNEKSDHPYSPSYVPTVFPKKQIHLL